MGEFPHQTMEEETTWLRKEGLLESAQYVQQASLPDDAVLWQIRRIPQAVRDADEGRREKVSASPKVHTQGCKWRCHHWTRFTDNNGV